MKRIIFMIIAVVVYTQSGSAQFITRINPANAGDPRVVFANPGAIGFISEPYIVAGYQNLYAGLPGTLTNSQIGAVLPTRFGHFAITGQNFTASMLSSSAIDLRYAYHLDKYRTSLGFSLGSLFTSYDKSRFHIIDDDDPLLSGDLSVNALDLGIGLTSNVWKNLILGINIDHLNKPALSLQGDFKKDMFLRAGFMYEFDRFKPMVMWEQEEGEHYFSAGTEYWFNNLPAPDVTALARAFVAPEYFSLGAGLIYKKLRLDYLFDYPLGDFGDLAGGTHQFVAAYTLAQSPFTLDVELMKPNVAEPARVPWCREVIYRINVIPAGGFNESVTLTMEDADGRSAARTITYDAEFGREIRKNDGEIGLEWESTATVKPGERVWLRVKPAECATKEIKFYVKAASLAHQREKKIRILLQEPVLVASVEIEKKEFPSCPPADTSYFWENYQHVDENEFIIHGQRFELLNNQANPFLNYLFFEGQSATPAYNYLNVLKTIAHYMIKERPESKVDITNCSEGASLADQDLLLQRAYAYKEIFQHFGVDSSRVHVLDQWFTEVNHIPVINDSVRLERQRFEMLLRTDDGTLLPPSLGCVFDLSKTIAPCGVAKWQFNIWKQGQGGSKDTTWSRNGDGPLPKMLYWNWEVKLVSPQDLNTTYYYNLIIHDHCGRVDTTATEGLSIGEQACEKTYLFLFPFDQARIPLGQQITYHPNEDTGGEPKLTIDDPVVRNHFNSIVEKANNNNAAIKVIGYTDSVGPAGRNEELSRRRAQAVRDYVVSLPLGFPENKISYDWEGEENALLPNDLPQGRLLNRRVEIKILNSNEK